ncbi:MAG: pyrroloquinoline quinone precursor peptide PqqA [Thiotrichaceae bacterium]|jgi:coenzyme PQQ precursor peptide PqqA
MIGFPILIVRRSIPMQKARKWTKPAFKEMRYGFEINLYIMNR